MSTSTESTRTSAGPRMYNSTPYALDVEAPRECAEGISEPSTNAVSNRVMIGHVSTHGRSVKVHDLEAAVGQNIGTAQTLNQVPPIKFIQGAPPEQYVPQTKKPSEATRSKRFSWIIAALFLVVVVGVVTSVVVVTQTRKDVAVGSEGTSAPSNEEGLDIVNDQEPEEVDETDDQVEAPEEKEVEETEAVKVEDIVPNVTQLMGLLSGKNAETANSLQDTTSPQYRAVEWVATNVKQNSLLLPKDQEYILQLGSLVIFFYSTLGDQGAWDVTTEWLDHDVSACHWYGVTCNIDGRVSLLDFGQGNSLAGTLPRELSLLSQLEIMDLNQNNIGGTVPSELGLLTTMTELSLGENLFIGSLPAELGRCTNLQFINVSYNLLGGRIPTQLGLLENLEFMYVHGNDFTGTVPESVCALDLDDLVADCAASPPNIQCDCCTLCV